MLFGLHTIGRDICFRVIKYHIALITIDKQSATVYKMASFSGDINEAQYVILFIVEIATIILLLVMTVIALRNAKRTPKTKLLVCFMTASVITALLADLISRYVAGLPPVIKWFGRFIKHVTSTQFVSFTNASVCFRWSC